MEGVRVERFEVIGKGRLRLVDLWNVIDYTRQLVQRGMAMEILDHRRDLGYYWGINEAVFFCFREYTTK